jgi:hypothetical protein
MSDWIVLDSTMGRIGPFWWMNTGNDYLYPYGETIWGRCGINLYRASLIQNVITRVQVYK